MKSSNTTSKRMFSGLFANFNKKCAALLAITVVAFAFSTFSQGQILTAYNQGWIANNTSYIQGNTNTYTGILNGGDYSSFFAFNLQGITSGSITSATLNLTGGYNVFTGTGTFDLYVSTINPSVTPNGYSGLTAGDLIGTVTGIPGSDNTTPTALTFSLNAQGLTDINNAARGNFIVGGAFSGGGLIGDQSAIFSSSGDSPNTLTLTTQAVPEPSTWAMLLGGLGLLAFWRTRTRRVTIMKKQNSILAFTIFIASLLAGPSLRAQIISSATSGDILYFPSSFNGSSSYGQSIGSGGNFAVGNDNAIWHAYAAFNTASLTGPISGASLSISTGAYNYFISPTTLSFYSYTSPTAPTADATSFNTMLSGPVIGSFSVPTAPIGNSTLTFQLNSAGVEALNADIASHSLFAVTATLPFNGSENSDFLFYGNSSIALDVAAAPEPSTWALMLGGLGLLAFWRTRARRALA